MSSKLELYLIDIPTLRDEADSFLHNDTQTQVPMSTSVEAAFDEYLQYIFVDRIIDTINRVAFYRMDVHVYRIEIDEDRVDKIYDEANHETGLYMVSKDDIKKDAVVGRYHLANMTITPPKKENGKIVVSVEMTDINHLKTYYKLRKTI